MTYHVFLQIERIEDIFLFFPIGIRQLRYFSSRVANSRILYWDRAIYRIADLIRCRYACLLYTSDAADE